jgi:hypothetical protein
MYCPQCEAEFRDGFTICSDCQVALVQGAPPEAPVPVTPDSQLDLVTVFESNDAFAIALAKGSLEDSGIPFWMDGDETAARLVLGPIVFPLCRFLAPKDCEADARDLLEPLTSPQEEDGNS